MNEFYDFEKGGSELVGLLFVSMALKKRADTLDERQCHLYCDGESIIGSDGTRLHIWKPLDCFLPVGYFKVLRKTKTSIWLTRKDIDQDFFEFKNITKTFGVSGKRVEFETKSNEMMYAIVIRAIENMKGIVSHKFFMDACKMPFVDWFEITQPNNTVGIGFKGDSGEEFTAVIASIVHT